ncbi:hypothetical protein AUG19_03120 [archaeon 13_1_20CM_2_54_9]|nr:MAG: hypothetical protein AUG19_03120 [archaeon 13_1_20CM_2_54_9]
MSEPPHSRNDEDVEEKLPAWARILLRLLREGQDKNGGRSPTLSLTRDKSPAFVGAAEGLRI